MPNKVKNQNFKKKNVQIFEKSSVKSLGLNIVRACYRKCKNEGRY